LEELDRFPVRASEKSDRGGDRTELNIFWLSLDRIAGLAHLLDCLERVGGSQGDMREHIRAGWLISSGWQRRE
jgi:hypothetical protein